MAGRTNQYKLGRVSWVGIPFLPHLPTEGSRAEMGASRAILFIGRLEFDGAKTQHLRGGVLGQRNIPHQQAQTQEEQAEGNPGEAPSQALSAKLGHFLQCGDRQGSALNSSGWSESLLGPDGSEIRPRLARADACDKLSRAQAAAWPPELAISRQFPAEGTISKPANYCSL